MIGIFDSGVGGLTVTKEILDVLPQYKVVYFGDIARMPYGTKSKEVVEKFAIQDINFLLSKDARIIIIGCNTVSAQVGQELRKRFKDMPIFDVLDPGVKAALKMTKNKKIGVIGTAGTINSKSHETLLKKLDAEVKVYSEPCPLLVPLVEENWIKRPETRKIVRKYLRPLRLKQIDTLILACTHYPLLKNVISDIMRNRVTLVDPAREVALEIKNFIEKDEELAKNLEKDGDQHEFYTSDIPYKSKKILKQFLGKDLDIRQVDIEKY